MQMDSNEAAAAKWLKDRLARCATSVFTETVCLTPALARELLKINDSNRPVKDVPLERYIKDVESNRWAFNGESIKVSACGRLNDGQHRCLAVVAANTPIMVMIVFGVQRETRNTLDQGAVRTPGDYLAMEGVSNANHCAAVAAMMIQHERYGFLSRSNEHRPTKNEVNEFFRLHAAEIMRSVKFAHKAGAPNVGGSAILAFCHVCFCRVDKERADVFIESLRTGVNLDVDDPIYKLRERLIKEKGATPQERAELIIRAWGHYLEGRSVTKLQRGKKEARKLTKLPAIASLSPSALN